MQKILITTEDGQQRLDKFLRRYLPSAPQSLLYRMMRKKNITVNREKTEGNRILKPGDEICLFFSDETFEKFRRQDNSFTAYEALPPECVIYEDSSILLVNKPAGWLSQRSSGQDVSLAERVPAYLSSSGKLTEDQLRRYRPGPANRLDRNTSGLIVFPLTLPAAQEVSEMFRTRSLDKIYLALVHGIWNEDQHQRAWFRRDARTNTTEISLKKTEGTDAVELICEPLCTGQNCTLLRVKLLTGKTHQIRAQLKACGYPLVGDPKYGTIEDTARKPRPGRQFLHAWKLIFPECTGTLETLSGKSFTAPVPADLKQTAEEFGILLPDHE